MRFIVDMPLPPALARWLSARGHDAVHALDIQLDRAPDAEIIRQARQARRIIITLTWTIRAYWRFPAQLNPA